MRFREVAVFKANQRRILHRMKLKLLMYPSQRTTLEGKAADLLRETWDNWPGAMNWAYDNKLVKGEGLKAELTYWGIYTLFTIGSVDLLDYRLSRRIQEVLGPYPDYMVEAEERMKGYVNQSTHRADGQPITSVWTKTMTFYREEMLGRLRYLDMIFRHLTVREADPGHPDTAVYKMLVDTWNGRYQVEVMSMQNTTGTARNTSWTFGHREPNGSMKPFLRRTKFWSLANQVDEYLQTTPFELAFVHKAQDDMRRF